MACCSASLEVEDIIDSTSFFLDLNIAVCQSEPRSQATIAAMSPAKQTTRKKPSAKKPTNSKQVTVSIHDAPKKPTIRHSFESAPK
jgi:hypothetical protein